MSRYYLYDGTNGKFIKFEDADSQPADSTTVEPDSFLPPYCPYWNGTSWELKKGPQIYYKIPGITSTSFTVNKNSVYEVEGTCQNLNLVIPSDPYLEESSVFFTLSGTLNDGAEHSVTFTGTDLHRVGSINYWRSAESYVITVYNKYIIIGVSKNN